MPRTARAAPGGRVHRVLNRGNGRCRLFHTDQDYDAFERLLAEVREAVPVRLLAWCLIPNHGSTERSPKSGTWCSCLPRTGSSRGSCSA